MERLVCSITRSIAEFLRMLNRSWMSVQINLSTHSEQSLLQRLTVHNDHQVILDLWLISLIGTGNYEVRNDPFFWTAMTLRLLTRRGFLLSKYYGRRTVQLTWRNANHQVWRPHAMTVWWLALFTWPMLRLPPSATWVSDLQRKLLPQGWLPQAHHTRKRKAMGFLLNAKATLLV